jgi:hypothetical protein
MKQEKGPLSPDDRDRVYASALVDSIVESTCSNGETCSCKAARLAGSRVPRGVGDTTRDSQERVHAAVE